MIIYTRSPSFSKLHKYIQIDSYKLRNSNSNIFKENHKLHSETVSVTVLSLRMSPHKCYCKQQVIQITTIITVIKGVLMKTNCLE